MQSQDGSSAVWAVMFLGAFIFLVWKRLHPPLKSVRAGVLDTVLFFWTPNDPFRAFDLLTHVCIFGRVGSGKTTGSGKLLAKKIVGYRRSGGLILAAKPNDRRMWQKIFQDAGRSKDLIVFSPSEPWRFNFLDYELRYGGHTRNIVQCLMTIGETLRSGNGGGRAEQDPFWRQQNERMLYNAVEIVKLATGRVSAPDLQQFISTAATSPEQLTTEGFQAGFHCQCMEAAHRAAKTPTQAHDFQMASDYWLGQIPSMAERTRSSIEVGVQGILHVFNSGLIKELVSGETNVTPDDMLDGRWILLDMTVSEWGDLGSFVCSGWKYLTQRRVLRRDARETDCINIIFADEAHLHLNSYDSTYLAQCREHLGGVVYLSQSLPGYFAAMKGESGEQQVLSLLSNFATTIVHASDAETADWASKRVGRRLETFFGGSVAPANDVYDDIFGHQRMTGSFSTNYESVVQPRVFMHGLRTGGEVNRRLVDGIVIRSGEPFSSGENHLWATFQQEN